MRRERLPSSNQTVLSDTERSARKRVEISIREVPLVIWSSYGRRAINLARQFASFLPLDKDSPEPAGIVSDPPAELESATDAPGFKRLRFEVKHLFKDSLMGPVRAETRFHRFSALEIAAPPKIKQWHPHRGK